MSGPYWTDTFNATRGCTPASAGCANCWARQMHERFHADPFSHVHALPSVLSKPLKKRKPTTFFVCNTSDLFHPSVPFDFIAAVYGVMAACPQHTFLTCTKRPERRAEFMRILDALVSTHKNTDPHLPIHRATHCWTEASFYIDFSRHETYPGYGSTWPLPNVWEGATVEDQERADERLAFPADWISAEPLLGPIDLTDSVGTRQVIIGGESGPNARPCDVAWIRDIVRQCKEAGVKCFVKQLGSHPAWGRFGDTSDPSWARRFGGIYSRAGSDPSEWPEDLRVRELGWAAW